MDLSLADIHALGARRRDHQYVRGHLVVQSKSVSTLFLLVNVRVLAAPLLARCMPGFRRTVGGDMSISSVLGDHAFRELHATRFH